MAGCEYKFNGKNFSNELELDRYLKENYNTIQAQYSSNDIVYDEGTRVQVEVLNKLSLASYKGISSTYEYNTETEEYVVKGANKLGLSAALTQMTKIGSNDPIVPTVQEDNFIRHYSEQLVEQASKNGETLNKVEAVEKAKQILKEGKIKAEIGTKVHKVAEEYFKNPDSFNEDDLAISTGLDISVIRYLKNGFNTVKNNITGVGENYRDYKFITEYSIASEDGDEMNIVGRLDLIAVSPEGEIEIFDFKVSDKPYGAWSSAKRINIDYQLVGYRALLANKGFKQAANASLNIIPITIKDIDFENATFQHVDMGSIINRTLEGDRRQLDFVNGNYTRNINRYIKDNIPEIIQNTDFSDDINKNISLAFGKLSEVTPSQFIKSKHYIKKDDIGTYFYDRTVTDDNGKNPKVYITKENREDKVTEYLAKLHEYNTSTFFDDVFKEIRRIQGMPKESRENTSLFENSRYKSIIKGRLIRTFEPYLFNEDWEIMEYPELYQMGIYAFKNKHTKIVNIITLTNLHLDSKLDLPNDRTSLFGKFDTDSVFDRNLGGLLLKGNNGNALLMITMLALNASDGIFNNYRIGNIQIMNHATGNSITRDDEILTKNFNVLCDRLNIENNFKKGIKFADRLEVIYNLFTTFTSTVPAATRNFAERASAIFADAPDSLTKEMKIEMLENILNLMLQDSKFASIINDPNRSFENPVIRVYTQVQEALLHYKDIHDNTDEDLITVDLNFKDLKRNLGVTGSYFDNPSNIENATFRKMVEITQGAFDKTRFKFMEFKQDQLKRVLKLYEDKGMSKVKRYTFQDARHAYDNMWVRDSNGKITKDFQVKNPYTDNTLTSAEKEFLKAFLWNINRHKVGLDGTMTEEQGVQNPEVQRLMATGEYFRVPLMKGQTLSRMTNQKFKIWANQVWDEQLNQLDMTEEEELAYKATHKDLSSYKEMYNRFDISESKREELLDEYDTGYFETNLELVEACFQHAIIRKFEFDKILPIIEAVRNVIGLRAYNLNVELPELNKAIDEYVRLVIFSESPYKDKNTLIKVANTLAHVTRFNFLGFNYKSLIREPLQGFFMMSTRALTRAMGENSAKLSDVMWAYKYVFSTLPSTGGDNFEMIELLNMMYRMANMEPNALAVLTCSDQKGKNWLVNKGAYAATSMPDFLNRMVFLIAQMKHDGCIDAHYMRDGKLVYDWTKDKRFKEFAKGPTNSKHPKYNEQKALYIRAWTEFNQQGYNLKFGDPLPMAYTQKESSSIKDCSDSLFGHFDSNDKMRLNNFSYGRIAFQFRTFFSATRERWYGKGHIDPNKGELRHKVNENGELLYNKIIEHEDGSVELIETTEKTDLPVMEFTGRFVEGMVQSTLYYAGYILKKYVKGESDFTLDYLKERKANTKQALLEIFLHMLISMLVAYMISSAAEDDKELPKDINQLVRATDEMTPLAMFKAFDGVPVIDMINNISSDAARVAKGNMSLGKMVHDNVALIRTIATLTPESLSNDEE